jgi:hypothetical protein
VYCPKAFAGIGALPDTVADRSIPIRLQAKKKGEAVRRFLHREVKPAADALGEQITAWVAEHGRHPAPAARQPLRRGGRTRVGYQGRKATRRAQPAPGSDAPRSSRPGIAVGWLPHVPPYLCERAVRQRQDIKQVQGWLGHGDPGFTLRCYVHLLDDGLGGADFFDQVFPSAPSDSSGEALMGRDSIRPVSRLV